MTTTKDDKLDLYKVHKSEYAAPKKPAIVETQPARYMVVCGEGAPGGPIFEEKVGALYGMAYTAKFQSKQAGRDYTVCKLEGLWWTAAGGPFGASTSPADLQWKLLIRVPDFITETQLAEARRSLREKGKEGDFDGVTLETVDEGRCIQMLHVGPYENEHETIDTMMSFAAEQGVEPHGRHHEIYLSDPRRVPPEKLRTIIRHPVR
jgi:hypothetical protein